MRLFFALWPDSDTRACLAAAALPEVRAANAVPPMNYHLTLAFVGEVADSVLPLLQQIGAARAVSCTCHAGEEDGASPCAQSDAPILWSA